MTALWITGTATNSHARFVAADGERDAEHVAHQPGIDDVARRPVRDDRAAHGPDPTLLPEPLAAFEALRTRLEAQ